MNDVQNIYQDNISTVVEIPGNLYDWMVIFIEKNPDWYVDRVFEAALSQFLTQRISLAQRISNQESIAA